MIDLETRLTELGELLAVTDADLSVDVLTTLDAPAGAAGTRRRPTVAVAVVVLLAVSIALIAWPGGRHAVESWLGLDRVRVERSGDGPRPTTGPAVATDDPLADRIVIVGGVTVVVGAIDGRLDAAFITKSVVAGGEVTALDIDGMPAIWVGVDHEVLLERDGVVVVERIAGRTLLWQDVDVLWRVEGFRSVDDAVEFARSL